MKTILILVASFLLITNAHAQDVKPVALDTSDSKIFNFHHRGVGFKVTIYSEDGVASELSIPKGAPLNVQFTEETSADLNFLEEGLPLTFLGDVVIRTGRKNQLPVITIEGEEMQQDARLQLNPPYQLNLTDVRVLVEKS